MKIIQKIQFFLIFGVWPKETFSLGEEEKMITRFKDIIREFENSANQFIKTMGGKNNKALLANSRASKRYTKAVALATNFHIDSVLQFRLVD